MRSLCFLFMFFFAFSLTFAQTENRIKIYVEVKGDAVDEGVKDLFKSELKKGLYATGEYQPVDYDAADESGNKLHKRMRSGAVDDEQIAEMGMQSGVQSLCVIEFKNMMGDIVATGKIVDIVSAESNKDAVVYGSWKESRDVVKAAKDMVRELLSVSFSSGGIKASQVDVVYKDFVDSRDGNKYKTAEMPDGNIWFTENLNYNSRGSYCYDNSSSNCKKIGRLYDYKSAINACPAGWHLPSLNEWTDFIESIGQEPGEKLKSKNGWSGNGNGTDNFGFNALSGGKGNKEESSLFMDKGKQGYYWTSTTNVGNGYFITITYNHSRIKKEFFSNIFTYSVRCIKD